MSDTPQSRAAYFDTLYAHNADPWHYQDRSYEIDKRADTLAMLPKHHYARGCEIGCSIGVLTADLAPRFDALLGVDISETAAVRARSAVANFPHVEIRVMHVPVQLPDGMFDMLMLSEVLYFLTPAELAALAVFAARQVIEGGDVMIVSYDGETLTALDGRQSTEVFTAAASPYFDVIEDDVRPHYHLRILRRRHD